MKQACRVTSFCAERAHQSNHMRVNVEVKALLIGSMIAACVNYATNYSCALACFQLNLPPDASERRRKQASKAALSRLAEKLQTTEGASEGISEKRYYISLTSKEGHKNHTFDTALSHAQPVDPRVSERIQTLVKGGITSVKEVQKCIRFFVQDVLFANETPPPESSRAFFPTKKDFENHIQTALRKERFSDEDQQNVMALVEDLKNREPTANMIFRPFQIRDICAK